MNWEMFDEFVDTFGHNEWIESKKYRPLVKAAGGDVSFMRVAYPAWYVLSMVADALGIRWAKESGTKTQYTTILNAIQRKRERDANRDQR